MKWKSPLPLLLLLSLLLTLTACGASGTPNTPATNPTEITTEPPAETTVPTEPEETEPPTEPEETEPAEAEPQLRFQDREPGAEPMTETQLQFFHWELARNTERWYEVILCQQFTSPAEIHFHTIFSNGIPSEPTSEMTYWEEAYLTQIGGSHATRMDADRISREKVLEVLCAYFDLTPEEAAQMDLGETLYYNEYTDSYYSLENSAYGGTPIFLEGYMPDPDTRVIYYCLSPGEEPTSRAVFWNDPDIYGDFWKVLEITGVAP